MTHVLIVSLGFFFIVAVVLARMSGAEAPKPAVSWAIRPFDYGHDKGTGIIGRLIQWATMSVEAHSFQYIRPLGRRPAGLADRQPRVNPLVSELTGRQGGFATAGEAQAWAEAQPALASGVPLVETWVTLEAWGDGVRYRIRQKPPVRVQSVLQGAEARHESYMRGREIVEAGTRYAWGEIVRSASWRLGIRVRRGPDTNPGRLMCSHTCALTAIAGVPELRQMLAVDPCEAFPGHLSVTMDHLVRLIRWVK